MNNIAGCPANGAIHRWEVTLKAEAHLPARDKGLNWGAPLCHPIPLAAVLILAINDHWLKATTVAPAWLTGKLSDIAGLFFFPALCLALVRGGATLIGRCMPGCSGALAVALVALTALVFTAAKLWPGFNGVFCVVWGESVIDRSDLLALPALGAAWIWLRARGAAHV